MFVILSLLLTLDQGLQENSKRTEDSRDEGVQRKHAWDVADGGSHSFCRSLRPGAPEEQQASFEALSPDFYLSPSPSLALVGAQLWGWASVSSSAGGDCFVPGPSFAALAWCLFPQRSLLFSKTTLRSLLPGGSQNP